VEVDRSDFAVRRIARTASDVPPAVCLHYLCAMKATKDLNVKCSGNFHQCWELWRGTGLA